VIQQTDADARQRQQQQQPRVIPARARCHVQRP